MVSGSLTPKNCWRLNREPPFSCPKNTSGSHPVGNQQKIALRALSWLAGPAGYKQCAVVAGDRALGEPLALILSAANKNSPTGSFLIGWTGRIRTCECWDQNPVPYHLATVQSFVILAQKPDTVEETTVKSDPLTGAAYFYDGGPS